MKSAFGGIGCLAVLFFILVILTGGKWQGLFGPPQPNMESVQVQSAATLVPPSLTQAAADSNLTNSQASENYARSTQIVADSNQGPVNTYLQGHEDGVQEGMEDAGYETTINRQQNSLQFWQFLAGGALCVFLGMMFLNAMTRR